MKPPDDERPMAPAATPEESQVFPLSFAQQRLWFLNQMSPGDISYNVPLGLRLRGRLDLQALRQALSLLVLRHDVLRTSFLVVDGQPCQVVHTNDQLAVAVRDFDLTEEQFESVVQRAIDSETGTPFALARGPLLRASILRNGDEHTVLLLTMHHAITDVWSLGVLASDVGRLYGACHQGAAPDLEQLAIQYGDYAVWQRERMTGDFLQRQLGYWRGRLDGAAALDLPSDRPRSSAHAQRGAWHRFRVSKQCTDGLIRVGNERRATLFMTMMSAWQVLLRAYSGQDDISVGTPIANRQLREIEELIGFFANTLVLRADLDGNPRFNTVLDQMRERALEGYAHQDLPFERLVEELRPERVLNRSPLFQVWLVLQNAPRARLELQGIEVAPLEIPLTTAKFDVSFYITPDDDGLACAFEYSTELFDRDTLAAMAGHLVQLLEAIAHDPSRRLDDLLCVPAPQPAAIATPAPRADTQPPGVCIHDAVATWAVETPDADAVISDEVIVSHRQLNAIAERIAVLLRGRGVASGTRIAIRTSSPITRIAAVLGVLKAGSSYMLLPSHPGADIGLAISRGRIDVVLADASGSAALKSFDLQVVLIDENLIDSEDAPVTEAALRVGRLDDGCLIAGSQAPGGKGLALVTHRAMSARWADFRSATGVGPNDVVATPPGDEYEFLLALAGGATVVEGDQRRRGAAGGDQATRERITVGCLTGTDPEPWREGKAGGVYPALRALVCGAGVPADVVSRWYETTGAPLVQRLASAETWWCNPTVPEGGASLPYIGNAQVVDRQQRPSLPGLPGELVLRGPSLAAGYLDAPALSAATFTPDGMGAAGGGGGRLYHSGIRARSREDGSIEVMACAGVERQASESRATTRDRPRLSRDRQAPIEQLLAGLFADVLGLDSDAAEALDGDSDFFKAGGHSLLATLVVSRLRATLGIELPLRAIFEAPTIGALTERLEQELSSGRSGAGSAAIPVLHRDGRPLPLSYAQQRLWLLDQLEPGSPAYNVPVALRLGGVVDVAVLRRCLGEVVRRHEPLRTRFVVTNGEPEQRIDDDWRGGMELEDLGGIPPDQREEALVRLTREDASRGFHLAGGPLFRARLVRVAAEDHVLMVTMHHIVSDGWSLGVLVRELAELYRSAVQGRPANLDPLVVQYPDYAVWQRRALEGDLGSTQRAYWRQRLAGAAPLDLPTDRQRPAVQRHRGALHTFRLSGELTRQLVQVGRHNDATLFMTLLSAWFVLLHRYSGQVDLSVGTPIANRQRSELEDLIGFFVNTLVLRADLAGNPSFVTLMGQVRDVALGGYAHQELPFEQVVEEVNPQRDLSRSPLFQVMFVLQNAPLSDVTLPGLRSVPFDVVTAAAKFDLTLSLRDDGRGLTGTVEYDTDLFDAATIARMMASFDSLLVDVARDPSQRIGDLSVVSPDEARLLAEWNRTDLDYPATICLHEMMEERARRTPDAPAVVAGLQVLTYRQIDARANAVAAHLRLRGVGPETLVGVCLDRSADLVVGILAVLKAGGGYVPLDPAYPRDRLAFIIDDAAAPLVLTQRRLSGQLAGLGGGHTVCIDELGATAANQPPVRTHGGARPDNTAYVIYTSGSTGRPKGVAIQHSSAVAFACWARTVFSEEELSGVLASTSVCFDLSIFELLVPLCWGGKVILAANALELETLPAAGEVRLINTVPSAMDALLDLGAVSRSSCAVNLAGEPLSQKLVDRIHGQGRDRRVLNLYGPTETTTYSTFTAAPAGERPHVGRPIANTRVYTLDGRGRTVPVGVIGEIHIGGAGVARGYLNRARLTAERFVPDPFDARPGARMYRTGDLGRWRADGTLELIGRRDHQVKIRGHRIELGEIESVLTRHPSVREAVAVLREDASGDKIIVAYVVGEDPADGGECRAYLTDKLPPYMVPARFERLAVLPRAPNGKVDRARLPAVLAEAGPSPVRAPETDVEQMLAEIWRELLGRREIGVDDNFFELGGHSLMAARLATRVRERSKGELPLRAIFEAPTIGALARRLAAPGGANAVPIPVVDRRGRLALSYGQQRFWLLDRLEPGGATYNLPVALRLHGALDVTAFRAALGDLVARHEALRTRFVDAGGEPRQEIDDAWTGTLEMDDLRHLPEAERVRECERRLREEATRGFDLARGPLFRVSLLRETDAEHVLLLTMHHIVFDGWSTSVLMQDLRELYTARAERRPSTLSPLSVQYADYAAWQRAQLEGTAGRRRIEYWRDRLAGAPPLELSTDRPRPAVQKHRGGAHTFRVPAPIAGALKQLGQQYDATLFMTLFSAWTILLSRHSGQTDVSVGVPVANRDRSELEHLIGFFVNPVVLRTDLSGAPSFVQLLGRVRESALGAFAPGDVPFEQVVEALRPERDLSRSPLFQVMFALQNAPFAEPHLGDVSVTALRTHAGVSQFDLSLSLTEDSGGLAGTVEYDADLFDHDTIVRMTARFETLLADVASHPQRSVDALSVLTLDDERLMAAWNATARAFPSERCVHDLVADWVKISPEAPAVLWDGQVLSYRELDERAELVARHLIRRGVGPESLVGVFLDRSPELVVAMLAVLKAGAGYVPLDPSYPRDRLAFMVKDAQLAMVLTHGSVSQHVPAGPANVLAIDHLPPLDPEDTPPRRRATAGNVAYVLYTSGSTGRPKGIAITHRSINRMIFSNCAEVSPDDCVAQVSNASFDAAPYEIWAALTGGARLAIIPREVALSPAALGEALQHHGVTFLLLTTALFNLVARDAPEALNGVRHMFFGGEAADAPSVRSVLSGRPPPRLLNLYGPAESTTVATAAVLDLPMLERSVPIGTPISNTRVYLLDHRQRRVPIGVAGEICIAGEGLARGYWNRPALTAERFLPDPYAEQLGARMYCTGDIGRVRGDGQLEFIGRTDDQVKIRGHRIEPHEVRTVLRRHPAVRDAVVWAERLEGGDLALVACVASPTAVTEGELTAYLRERLPAYMIPATTVCVRELPLTPNGKIDRRMLGPMLPNTPDAGRRAPATEMERAVAEIWSEVLGRTELGVDESLFDLGGHSLMVATIATRIRERTAIDVPLRAIFEAPTIAALAKRLDEQRASGAERPPSPSSSSAMATVDRSGALPLSYGQQRLWVLDQLEPGNPAYVVPLALQLEGPLDIEALRLALADLVTRHEPLRTRVVTRAGTPEQQIAAEWQSTLQFEDLTTAGGEAPGEEKVERRLRQEASRPFDLCEGPLFRAVLVRVGATDHRLLLTMHHIVTDGWSMGVLLRELGELYRSKVDRRPSRLARLPFQYADYAVWQRAQLEGERGDRQAAYWRERLAGTRALDLPTDFPRRAVQSQRGATHSFSLPADLMRRLTILGQRREATPFMTLFSAWSILLHRYSGQTDVCVGTPIANRGRSELEGMVGFFVNTLVMRVDLSGALSVTELLGRVRKAALESYTHQDLPFERVVEDLRPERDLSRSPLFQVMFVMQNVPSSDLRLPGLTVHSLPLQTGFAKFDLTLFISSNDAGRAEVAIEYCTDLFEAATIRRMAGHFRTLLQGMVDRPEAAVSALPLLTEEERSRQLVEWNDTRADLQGLPRVHEMIAAQAAQGPDAPAVAYKGQTITRGELDGRASRLASALRRAGVGAESIVSICVDRPIEMVVACLGVLKAGGAYLPVDQRHPPDRLRYVLSSSKTRLMLTSGRATAAGVPEDVRVLDVCDPRWQSPEDRAPAPAIRVQPDNLAYVIYTSGSTGLPKGVSVTHEGLANYVRWANGAYRLGQDSRSVVHSPLGFDLTVTSLWCPLAAGGVIELVDPEHAIDGLIQAIRTADGPRLLKLTPAHLAMVAESFGKDWLSTRADTLVIGGEALPASAIAPWSAPGSRARLINEYGPTETVVGCCIQEIDRPVLNGGEVPIGRPIDNTAMYLLDRFLEPVPIGVPGELYIAGAGVARGYLGRPDLTAERFVPNPFAADGRRMYRTGDLGKYRPDGALEFLGRTDSQVKLRGFRIELGEVEAAIRQHPDVRDAAVALVRAGGQLQLRAFVASGGAALSAESLRAFAKQRLPDYMVPASFVLLSTLPLTSNGKVDRATLASMSVAANSPDETSVEPRDATEEQLAEVWRAILDVRAGVTDDFFEVGGTSMSALRLVSVIEQRFGRRLRLAQVFTARTIEAQAALLRGDAATVSASPLVDLAPAVTGARSLFCVHPIGGSIDVYHVLARSLAGQRGCSALQAVCRDRDLVAMAARYVGEMRRVQPDGPYLLCGWSFGAAVAFEMARQLAASGQVVERLVLIDPTNLGGAVSSERSDLLLEVAHSLGLTDTGLVSVGGPVDAAQGSAPFEDQLERMLARARRQGVIAADISNAELRSRFDVFVDNRKALELYRPTTYQGRATLIWASNRPDSERRQWQSFLAMYDETVIDGDHYQIMTHPHVLAVARLFAGPARAVEQAAGPFADSAIEAAE